MINKITQQNNISFKGVPLKLKIKAKSLAPKGYGLKLKTSASESYDKFDGFDNNFKTQNLSVQLKKGNIFKKKTIAEMMTTIIKTTFPRKNNYESIFIEIKNFISQNINILADQAYINKAQKIFKKVFMRDDITKEETLQILNRYKNIGKIKNKEEYIRALFNEAKTNYGFEKGSLDIKFFSQYTPNINSNLNGIVNIFTPFVNINKDSDKLKILKTIHHEMRHKKQFFMMLNQCETLENFLKAAIGLHKVKPTKNIEETIQNIADEITTKFPNWLKQFGIEKLSKSNIQSKHNDYVEHLLKEVSKYKAYKQFDVENNNKYFKSFCEKDARHSSETIQEILTWVIH